MHSRQLLTGSHTLLLGRLKDFAFLVSMTFRNIGCSLVLISSSALPPKEQRGSLKVRPYGAAPAGDVAGPPSPPHHQPRVSCICDSEELQGTGEGKDEGEREEKASND